LDEKPHRGGILVAPDFNPGLPINHKKIVRGKMLSKEQIYLGTKRVKSPITNIKFPISNFGRNVQTIMPQRG